MRTLQSTVCLSLLSLSGIVGMVPLAIAQTAPVPQRGGQPPSQAPLPTPQIEPIPDVEQLLPSSPETPAPPDAPDIPATVLVKGFTVTGSTVFSQEDLQAAIAEAVGGAIPPEGRKLSLNEVFNARTAITELYAKNGYITSGAFIPPQKLDGAVVEIRVLEGRIEDIRVTGNQRLNSGYISSRLGLGAQAPLNQPRLLEALQLLQLNPLIGNISAELSAGTSPGTNLLEVTVNEAQSAFATFTVDNQRVPSVGSVRGQALGVEQNLLGYGDTISLSFTKTQGSNALDFTYSLPVSPRNTTVSFNGGLSTSSVIEAPFDVLDIESQSYYLELTGRHPLIQTPTQELALGLTLGRRTSKTTLLGDLPFPSPGADLDGRTTSSVVRFFQEFTQRSSQSVFAARSQLNLGVEALGATNNDEPPDTQFFSWRLQSQWVRLLAPDTLLLVRGDLQLADRPLLPVEQLGIGGVLSLRGYRQDLLLTDNGVYGSVEGRIPILRLPKQQAIVHFTPFVDVGRGWNLGESPDPDPGFLASLGFGLRLSIGSNFSARMEFGFPLVDAADRRETLQEKGIYFSIVYTPF